MISDQSQNKTDCQWLHPERIWTGKGWLHDHLMLLEEGVVKALIPVEEAPTHLKVQSVDRRPGETVAPGLIDLQLNGLGGLSLIDEITPERLRAVHDVAISLGTTSFLPTFVSTSLEKMEAAVVALRQAEDRRRHGLLGIHFEGPYLNPLRQGIHELRFIRLPQAEEWDRLLSWAPEIAMMTLAPERLSKSLWSQLVARGVVLAMGHSEASYEVASDAFEGGFSMVTHMFNAMPPFQGRSPGILGAAWEREDLFYGIIPDGHHVAWPTLRFLRKHFGQQLTLVSDALASAASHLQQFEFCGTAIEIKDGVCQNSQGRLAGANLDLAQGLKLWIEKGGATWEEAYEAASTRPARLLGVDDRLGLIEVGYVANLVAWDTSLHVTGSWFEGKLWGSA